MRFDGIFRSFPQRLPGARRLGRLRSACRGSTGNRISWIPIPRAETSRLIPGGVVNYVEAWNFGSDACEIGVSRHAAILAEPEPMKIGPVF
jgi:hypothetical protein